MSQREFAEDMLVRAARGGSEDEQRRAAIEFCRACDIDPHFKYPIYERTSLEPWEPGYEQGKLYYEEEWQRVLARAKGQS